MQSISRRSLLLGSTTIAAGAATLLNIAKAEPLPPAPEVPMTIAPGVPVIEKVRKESVVLNDRRDLTTDVYRRVCWNHAKVDISPKRLKQIDVWRQEFIEFLQKHPELNVYGVNVHPGDKSKVRLSKDELKEALSQGLNTGVSFGDPLPNRVVRGIVLGRLSGMLNGNSASSANLANHMCRMLDRKMLPLVPREGQGGAGEVCPLGILFDNVPREIHLGIKEPMTLINGHPTATSLCVDAYLRSVGLLNLTEEIFCLAADGLRANNDHFKVQLETCWDDPDEQKALQRIRALLKDAPVKRLDGQAKTCVRNLPLIFAAARKAQRHVKEVAETVLRSAHDNPLWIPASDGMEAWVCSNGSYHTQIGMVAPDDLSRAYADLAVTGLHLVQAFYSDRNAMPDQDNLIFGNIPMNAADWADEARTLAVPSILPCPQWGQNDMPSPYMRAWTKVDRLEVVLIGLLTQVAIMASQSIYMRGDLKTSPALTSTLKAIRECSAPLQTNHRRTIGKELDLLYRRMQKACYVYSAMNPEDRPKTVLEAA